MLQKESIHGFGIGRVGNNRVFDGVQDDDHNLNYVLLEMTKAIRFGYVLIPTTTTKNLVLLLSGIRPCISRSVSLATSGGHIDSRTPNHPLNHSPIK